MGSKEMAKIADWKHRPYTDARAKRALRLYIKELKGYLTVSPRAFKRWGYDDLSAKVAWIGNVRQQEVFAKHYLAMVEERGVKKTQRRFELDWDKTKKGAKKDSQKREMGWHFNHFNEMTEGLLRKD